MVNGRSEVMQVSAQVLNSVRNVTREELADLIEAGHSFLGGVFQPRRKTECMRVTSLITVDFDKGDTTLPQLIEAGMFGLIYETFSHTEENPRYRGVCFLQVPITDKPRAVAAVKAVYAHFPSADQQCSDVTRLILVAEGVVWSIWEMRPSQKVG